MKDIIKRSIITIIGVFIIIFLIYSLYTGKEIVKHEYIDYNNLYYIVLILIFSYKTIIHGLYPVHIKINKPVLFFIGITLIIISKTVLNNDGQLGLYFGDIFIVIGVIITLLSPTNILIPQKIINKKSKKIQIIEV